LLYFGSIMMKRETIAIADIYVPTKRRGTLEQKRVDEIAASILDKGLQAPILVRADGARLVLVEGLHRLEAAKALGENRLLWGFRVDRPRDVFSRRGVHRRWLSERRYLFANILFGRLHGRNVSLSGHIPPRWVDGIARLEAIEYQRKFPRIGGVNSSTTAAHSSWLRKTGLSAPLGMVGMIWNCSVAADVRLSASGTPDSFGRSMAVGL
jgi:sulfiredoxin